jgi:ATP-binding cassette subfamily F protein 3
MIRLENLSKSFADKIILNKVHYHFPQGERIALVGANGAGKTTLLNIITGIDESDSGLVIKPREMCLAFLPQAFNANPETTLRLECMAGHQDLHHLQRHMTEILQRMEVNYCEEDYHTYEGLLSAFEHKGGYQLEGLAEKILLGLGFKPEQLDQHPTVLSGGWRMRLELAKVLVAKPDFLILDEPTNHLDLPSIEWLEMYLQDYQGTLLFVSHDRAFLNRLATITVYLNQGQMQPFAGNFDDFLESRQQTQKTQEATLKKINKQKAHMQRFVDRFRAQPTKAGQVGSRMKMIERLQNVMDGMPAEATPPKIHFPKLQFPQSGKDVLTLKGLTVGYTKPLIRNLTVSIQRGQRLAIVGANGIGKSTLLKTIGGVLAPLSGDVVHGHNVQMGFYTQEAADQMDKKQSVFNTLAHANTALSEQMCRAVLGALLFKGNDLAKLVGVLSGGERSRLALACLLAQLPNFLLLDEPTNHLDMVSLEVLAEMLCHYTGTVIFVSHDRYLIEQVATSVIEVGERI